MDSSRFSLLSSLRGEFKAEDYIQPHYKEAYRLAIDRLLSGGRDSYQEFLKGERVGTFLSEDELTFITTNAEQPPTQNQTEEINIQNQMDTQSSSGTYWPMHSDVDTPDLDLGWPEVRHDKLQTNIDLLFHPPRQNNRTIKEVIRKHIQDARQVMRSTISKGPLCRICTANLLRDCLSCQCSPTVLKVETVLKYAVPLPRTSEAVCFCGWGRQDLICFQPRGNVGNSFTFVFYGVYLICHHRSF